MFKLLFMRIMSGASFSSSSPASNIPPPKSLLYTRKGDKGILKINHIVTS